MEHKFTYGLAGAVPIDEYTIPLGTADVKRTWKDVVILTWSYMVHIALKAAEVLAGEGIDAEVIDLRTLNPLDEATILQSVKKIGKVLILHEACRTSGFGGEISAMIAEKAFDDLDSPIKRVTAPDTPVPYAPVLEHFFMPHEENVIQAVRQMV